MINVVFRYAFRNKKKIKQWRDADDPDSKWADITEIKGGGLNKTVPENTGYV